MTKTKAELIQEAESILDRADAENRELTEAEEKHFNALTRRAQLLATGNFNEQRQVPAQGFDQEGGIPAFMSKPLPSAPLTDRVLSAPIGSLRAFGNSRQGQEQAYRAGQWLRASLLGNTQAADWCRTNGVGIRSALAGGVAAAGGVLVPEELSSAIINLQEQYGVFRRFARTLPMGSDTLNIPRKTGGLTAYYVGENTAGTETDSTWDNVSLVAKKLMILTRMSSEIQEDAVINLADFLAMECAQAFSLQEDRVGFTGTGIATDGGIVGVNTKIIDGTHTLAVIDAASGHDTLVEIDANDLISTMAAIPVYARQGAAWYCSPTAEAVVFDAIKIAGGGNTSPDLAMQGMPRFLGYPIVTCDVLPDSATTNYNNLPMLLFGNLALAATMGARRDIRIALSTEQYWEEDQVGLKATQRFDINIHDLGSTTVKSPLAALLGTT